MRIGYGKVGRSMPLTLDQCGTVGGDVECVPVVKDLALKHPGDTFVLVGRNSGEDPQSVGLPPNVENPWTQWRPQFREWLNANEIYTAGRVFRRTTRFVFVNGIRISLRRRFLGLMA